MCDRGDYPPYHDGPDCICDADADCEDDCMAQGCRGWLAAAVRSSGLPRDFDPEDCLARLLADRRARADSQARR